MTEHSSWPDRLKWAEEHGLKSLQEKFATADNMAKEAQTTLTYVLSGLGGTFVYIIPGLNRPLDAVLFGTIVLCFYFFLCGAYLVRKAFFISAYPSPYQEPKNLLEHPNLSLDEVRFGETQNIDERIEKSKAWIDRKAKTINRIRLALILSPIAFALGFALFKYRG